LKCTQELFGHTLFEVFCLGMLSLSKEFSQAFASILQVLVRLTTFWVRASFHAS